MPLLTAPMCRQRRLQRFCLSPLLLIAICPLLCFPLLERLFYILIARTVQVLMKGVAAPPLRLTSGTANLLTQCLLLEMQLQLQRQTYGNCNHNDYNPLNHDNGNIHCLKHHAKHHIHSSSVSRIVSSQPYVRGVRRIALGSSQLHPCPVDVPSRVTTTTVTVTRGCNWLMWRHHRLSA